MADPRANFPVLEDASTGAGLPLHKVLQGDPLASKNALAALGFKNAGNNLRYPLVDENDILFVRNALGYTANLSEKGELAAGSIGSIVDVTGASLTLQNSKVINGVSVIVSCRRGALFQIVWDDDGVESVLGEVVLDAGQYSFSDVFPSIEFTTGATGDQFLKLKAKNFEAPASSLRGTISAVEVQ